jgi:hypothetical protein
MKMLTHFIPLAFSTNPPPSLRSINISFFCRQREEEEEEEEENKQQAGNNFVLFEFLSSLYEKASLSGKTYTSFNLYAH